MGLCHGTGMWAVSAVERRRRAWTRNGAIDSKYGEAALGTGGAPLEAEGEQGHCMKKASRVLESASGRE